ncbi:MAG TPA: TonB family protein [Sphingomicrobium sp.]|nr:TonB family protein [Sphingomicrobium sp.]
MLAYLARRPAFAARQSSPNAMLVIIGAHVALLAAVMSAKMDLPAKLSNAPIRVKLLPAPVAPPPNPIERQTEPQTRQPHIAQPQPAIDLPPAARGLTGLAPSPPAFDPAPGSGEAVTPPADPGPPAVFPPVRVPPRLTTPPSELKPPYPLSKLSSGEEAVLTLRLSIDENGRVVAVEPVGRADRVFLDAARRHVLARWRFRPATEDGRPITGSTTITLRFQLDG